MELLRGVIVGHYSRAERFCGALYYIRVIAGRYFGMLLRGIIEGRYCGALSRGIIAG
jgi:hypothetical protein